jgi:hypothetical protein
MLTYSELIKSLEEIEEKALPKKKTASDRVADAKKRKKYAKTAGGKKAAIKAKKHADKVKKGTVKVDKERSRRLKKTRSRY